MHWTISHIPDQSKKTVVITGANSGIGLETAKVLAAANASVILACRNASKGRAAVDMIKNEVPGAKVTDRILDLSSLSSIRSFSDWVKQSCTKLDLLINNAGVMATPYCKTADGFEMQFGTNHLGHFALTGLLLELLSSSPEARVLTVSSQAHRIGKIDFENLNAEKSYHKIRAYAQSKLSNLLFAYELERRLRKSKHVTVKSVAAHPGSTSTNLTRNSPLLNLTYTLKLSQNVNRGALPSLRAISDPEVKGGDYYGPGGFMRLIGDPVKETSSARSYDREVAAHLWRESEKLTGIQYLTI